MNYGDKGIKQKKKLLNSATTKLGTKLGIFFIKLALVGIIALVVAGSCLVFGSFQGIIENAPCSRYTCSRREGGTYVRRGKP